jgi:hypothetical protein
MGCCKLIPMALIKRMKSLIDKLVCGKPRNYPESQILLVGGVH